MNEDPTDMYVKDLEDTILKLNDMLATKNKYPVFIIGGGTLTKNCFAPSPGDKFDSLGAGVVEYVHSSHHPDFGTCHTWKLQCGSAYRTDSFGFHRFRNTNDDFNIIGKHNEEPETDSPSRPAVEAP